MLGPDHPDSLRTRNNLASWTGRSGDLPAAVAQFGELLRTQLRVLGADHPNTLISRNNQEHWLRQTR